MTKLKRRVVITYVDSQKNVAQEYRCEALGIENGNVLVLYYNVETNDIHSKHFPLVNILKYEVETIEG